MGEENHTHTEQLVTEDHCDQVSLRIEGKLDRLIDILEPKLEMIVRMDTSFRWLKGIVLFVCSGGILTGIYKGVKYLTSMKH